MNTTVHFPIGQKNANGRIYTEACFHSIKSAVDQGRAFVKLYRDPSDGTDGFFELMVAKVDEIQQGQDRLDLSLTILETPSGAVGNALLQGGNCSVTQCGQGYVDDQGVVTDYQFSHFNLFPNDPSFK